MYLSNVALDDYRSWRHVVVELDPGVCVLLGRNGQGKTNFVEALTYVSRLHSHRVSADTALVRFPSAAERETGDTPGAAVIRVKAIEADRSRLVDVEIVAGKANRARIGRTQVAPRDIIGEIRTVLFAPEDLEIVRGDPAKRRRFLDDLAIMKQPVLAGVRSEHERVLAQRGALLKRASTQIRRGFTPDVLTLDIWDNQLAPLAARMIAARAQLVAEIGVSAKAAYRTVSDQNRELHLQYRPSLAKWASDIDFTDAERVGAALLDAYTQLRDDELRRGVNLVGAHRDDLELHLETLPVRGFASHGETWSVALALRLAEFELLRHDGPVPILILDDVFAELDSTRRRALLQVIDEAEQVFITAAVAEDIPTDLDATIYRVACDSAGISTLTRQEQTQ